MDHTSSLPDMAVVAARVLDILGGREKAIAAMEAEYDAMKARWNKDVVTIGRILRAHLHVEFYLTEFLQQTNPRLGKLDESRISFIQKVNLLPNNDQRIDFIVPGIRHLNKIRNRLAHNLGATVTTDDANAFLQGLFKAFRDASVSETTRQLSNAPIDILEEFSEFASSMLHSSSTLQSKAFSQAIDEIKTKSQPSAGS